MTVLGILVPLFLVDIASKSVSPVSVNDTSPLIPRNDFVKSSPYSSVRVDGKVEFVSFLTNDDDDPLFCWRRLPTIENNSYGNMTCLSCPAQISDYLWLHDNRSIIMYERGYSAVRIWLLEPFSNAPELRKVIDFSSYLVSSLSLSFWRPDEVLLFLSRRGRVIYEPHVLNVKTGKLKRVFRNENFSTLVMDDHFRLVMVGNVSEDGLTNYYKAIMKSELEYDFQFVKALPAEVAMTLEFVVSSPDSTRLYWTTSEYTDKVALVEEHLENGTVEVIYSPKYTDIHNIIFNPYTAEFLLVEEYYMTLQVGYMNDKITDDCNYLIDTFGLGKFSIQSISQQYDRWLILVFSDVNAGMLYLYLNSKGRRMVIFLDAINAVLLNHRLARKRAVEVPTRDGLIQLCYLTIPPTYNVTNDGQLPSGINMIHGGPNSRVYWEYSAEEQLLANRGYVVLQCNFRGSTGFGKEFLAAGFGEWGGRMQDDIDDAFTWAANNGLVGSNRTAIMGASYGGFATLYALAYTPDKYQCGVAECAPSDLVEMFQSMPREWNLAHGVYKVRFGASIETEEGKMFLWKVSPLRQASSVRKPLLIAHGLMDDRVPTKATDAMAEALVKSGANFTYMVFPNEGHCIYEERSMLAYFAVIEQLFARCLNGSSEPVGNSLEDLDITLEQYPLAKMKRRGRVKVEDRNRQRSF
ncbi:hypothetical protein M513_01817 [Trichuris suis]|uniref:Peptidase S9 prolyl oligopeptidase catalytic domain-containing protein n=1 Tax=Trichuris suis TaxID=68888 RepID=A0A085MJB0_9BILA|nr:hypothetical protein M513_01817 [Trichuris suis]